MYFVVINSLCNIFANLYLTYVVNNLYPIVQMWKPSYYFSEGNHTCNQWYWMYTFTVVTVPVSFDPCKCLDTVAEEAIHNRGQFKLPGHICMEKSYISIEGYIRSKIRGMLSPLAPILCHLYTTRIQCKGSSEHCIYL